MMREKRIKIDAAKQRSASQTDARQCSRFD
ncbi:hypothetical protein OCOJLMKI_3770 [Methylobacterium iners]|uniref:Transposase n=1 Tax=Methylobacterium iners TaxID=418707 RepID=A0ABQ4S0B2_9HYPH|nr:hypothetical protein OCOJLMKI_3770 [Methylobacterium iners]